jgi:hypothetical protein
MRNPFALREKGEEKRSPKDFSLLLLSSYSLVALLSLSPLLSSVL